MIVARELKGLLKQSGTSILTTMQVLNMCCQHLVCQINLGKCTPFQNLCRNHKIQKAGFLRELRKNIFQEKETIPLMNKPNGLFHRMRTDELLCGTYGLSQSYMNFIPGPEEENQWETITAMLSCGVSLYFKLIHILPPLIPLTCLME